MTDVLEEDIVLLSDIVGQIKDELAAAQQVVIGPPALMLESVEVELAAVSKKSIDGKLSIGLISGFGLGAEGALKHESRQKIALVLKPPEPVIVADAERLVGLELAELIVATRRELQLGMEGDPQLDPDSLVFDIHFGVERVGKAGPKFKFLFVEIGSQVTKGSTESGRIKLQFAPIDMPA